VTASPARRLSPPTLAVVTEHKPAAVRPGLSTSRRPRWWDKAQCLGHDDPDLFHDPKREDEAREFCRDCPVRQDCMNDALDRGDLEGVWGGTTDDQRRQIFRIARALNPAPEPALEDLEGPADADLDQLEHELEAS
jgi:hypothetical protein